MSTTRWAPTSPIFIDGPTTPPKPAVIQIVVPAEIAGEFTRVARRYKSGIGCAGHVRGPDRARTAPSSRSPTVDNGRVDHVRQSRSRVLIRTALDDRSSTPTQFSDHRPARRRADPRPHHLERLRMTVLADARATSTNCSPTTVSPLDASSARTSSPIRTPSAGSPAWRGSVRRPRGRDRCRPRLADARRSPRPARPCVAIEIDRGIVPVLRDRRRHASSGSRSSRRRA